MTDGVISWRCTGFGNNITTARYGIVSIFEKVLKFTGNIVDFHRSFKCCAQDNYSRIHVNEQSHPNAEYILLNCV